MFSGCLKGPSTGIGYSDPLPPLQVHPNSDSIKMHISLGSHLHPDFGGGTSVNGQRVLYGIPFTVLDSSRDGTPLNPIDVIGYGRESAGGWV